jgi:hypothetical protein
MQRYQKDSFIDASRIPTLKPILEGWLQVQLDYAKAMKHEDYAWWYRERTCIGFLSAGAWRSGSVTLEQWQIEKGSKRRAKHGRCDLYIMRRGQEFFIEAKHMYSRATGSRMRELRYIQYQLDLAVDDASKLRCKPSQQLGILFIAPFYPPGKHPGDFDAHISEWLAAVASIAHSAMGWLYQPRRKIQGKRTEYISPGIVLLARTVR